MRTMKSILLLLILLVVAYALFMTPDPTDDALEEVAGTIVAAIPEDVHVRILAVGEFDGEHGGRLRDFLIGTIGSETDFVLVERDQVDRLLTEQGFQAGQLVDPDARVRFGQMLGAEGILFGEVESARGWFGSSTVTVRATMDDVQRGTVSFSDRFEETGSNVRARTAWLAALALAVLYVLASWIGYSRQASRHAKVDRAQDKRFDAVAEVRHADRLLGDLQTRAAAEDDTLALKVRDIRNRLSDFRQELETAASGDPDLQAPKRDRQMLTSDSDAARALVEFRESVQGISSGGGVPGAGALDDLMEQVRGAEAAYRGRKVQ